MPESEVPWEFLVDAPERRKKDRRVNEKESCNKLLILEAELNHLANEFYAFKRSNILDNQEASDERKQIIEKLDQINSHLDKQKGFFAGAVWIGSAVMTFVIAVVGLAINYIKG